MISVVITTYNSELTIAQAIQSVINQSYKNFEILVFDDLSNDNTTQIVEFIKSTSINKINLFIAQKNNGGPAFGRNWGIANSKGKYVCFLDADDYWFSDKLETQVNFMENNDYAICSSNAKMNEFNTFPVLSGDYKLFHMIFRNKIILSSSILNLRFIKDKKIIFNTSHDFIGVEDYDFFLRIMLNNGKLRVLSHQLIFYTVFNQSLSHKNQLLNELRRINVLQKLKIPNVFLNLYKYFIILIFKIYVKIRFNCSKL